MLVDHLVRNPEKQLLRGKVGRIHSWIYGEGEEQESSNEERIILEHVPLCDIPGALGPGIYPIFQTERTWKLDGYRGKKAVLAIKRKQIPLAPALACTAHSAQGQTLEAVIADLVVGRGSVVSQVTLRSRE